MLQSHTTKQRGLTEEPVQTMFTVNTETSHVKQTMFSLTFLTQTSSGVQDLRITFRGF